jgi:hypothetical protein
MSDFRWVVIIEAEGGGTSVYGPWRQRATADIIADKLRAKSRRYNGDPDAADFTCAVEALESWPGFKAALLGS